MNGKEWLQAFGSIDPQYIEEADPTVPVPAWATRRRVLRLAARIAACLCLVTVIGMLVLTVPFPVKHQDLSAYKDSPYYALMQSMDHYNGRPQYRNLLDLIWNRYIKARTLGSGPDTTYSGDGSAEPAADASPSDPVLSVPAVRLGSYLYYADGCCLKVYRYGTGSLPLLYSCEAEEFAGYGPGRAQLLPDEQKGQLIMLFSWSDPDGQPGGSRTSLITYDLSDPARPRRTGTAITVSGAVQHARLTDGTVTMVCAYTPAGADYSDPQTFVPGFDSGTGWNILPAEHILFPDEACSDSYSVVVNLNTASSEITSIQAFYASEGQPIVTNDRLLISRLVAGKGGTVDTELLIFSFGDGASLSGTVHLSGELRHLSGSDDPEEPFCAVTQTEQITPFSQAYRYRIRAYQIDPAACLISKEAEYAPFESLNDCHVFRCGNRLFLSFSLNLDYSFVFLDLSTQEIDSGQSSDIFFSSTGEKNEAAHATEPYFTEYYHMLFHDNQFLLTAKDTPEGLLLTAWTPGPDGTMNAEEMLLEGIRWRDRGKIKMDLTVSEIHAACIEACAEEDRSKEFLLLICHDGSSFFLPAQEQLGSMEKPDLIMFTDTEIYLTDAEGQIIVQPLYAP